ncbi:MAG: hypothetical protein KC518_06520 [Candidatus Cloacimonetes bacterium]|nr:hypothetical protein [Candidatus Cloacimonadota bacterium]
MRKMFRIGEALLWLGLLAGFTGCNDGAPADHEEGRVFQTGEVQLVQPDLLVQKAALTDGGSSLSNLLSPDYFDFTVRPDRITDYDHGYFSWYSQPGTVASRTNIAGTWMGPRGFYGYDMSPHGLNFGQAVDLGIDVTPVVILGLADVDNLVMLLDNEDGTYTEIPATVETMGLEALGTLRYQLKGTVWHFSKYVIGIGPPPGGSGDN